MTQIVPIEFATAGRARTYLGAAEARVYSSFRFPKRRRDYLAGRIAAKRLVRKTLEKTGDGLRYPNLEILNDSDGKPFVQVNGKRLPWSISISHSPEAASCAVRRRGKVGLDLERIENRNPAWLDIAFHPSERSPELDRSPELQTRFWTLKEAVSKLLGVGLSVDLWDIRFPGTGTGGQGLTSGLTPEFHGAAQKAWQNRGCPSIRCRSRKEENHFVSLAYSKENYGRDRKLRDDRSSQEEQAHCSQARPATGAH